MTCNNIHDTCGRYHVTSLAMSRHSSCPLANELPLMSSRGRECCLAPDAPRSACRLGNCLSSVFVLRSRGGKVGSLCWFHLFPPRWELGRGRTQCRDSSLEVGPQVWRKLLRSVSPHWRKRLEEGTRGTPPVTLSDPYKSPFTRLYVSTNR